MIKFKRATISARVGMDVSEMLPFKRMAQSQVLSQRGRCVRLGLLGFCTFAWIGLVIWRLVSLQITDVGRWEEWALKQHLAQIKLSSERGPLYDRNGRLMAVSVPAGSVYVRPAQIRDKQKVASTLSTLLKIDKSTLQERLAEKNPFVWIRRQVPRAVAEQIAAEKMPGVGYIIEARRYYPFNQAASSLIGRVGVDGTGLSGLELRYEQTLHGEHVTTTARRDALGNLIQSSLDSTTQFEPPRGNSLSLTIDAPLQNILDEELELGRRSTQAKATMGVLMDAESGEILAMGQSPNKNFNQDGAIDRDDLRNLVLETVFEPGSILKPLIAATALQEKVITTTELLDCGKGHMTIGRNTIKDVHPYDLLNVRDVIVRSSNIGMSRIGLRLGRERIYDYLTRLGFGHGSNLSLPGMTDGLLRKPANWALIDEATHSFGHGLAVTPLQMVRSISAIANGGTLYQPSILLDEVDQQGTRIFNEKITEQVREMMYAVVEDPKGTGRKAAISGVRVAGKTGTAQKPRKDGRGYEDGKYVASFVGFVDGTPLGVPHTYTLIVVVDEPKAESIYGGVLAAPIFQRVMQRSLHSMSTSFTIQTPTRRSELTPASADRLDRRLAPKLVM